MSRDIKFRYTVVRENGYIFHQDFTIEEIDEGAIVVWLHANNIDVNTLYRRQCMGRKDKNGKEIYEGDIYRIFDFTDEEDVFGEKRYAIIRDTRGLFSGFSLMSHHSNCEVIGNIYENPELLEA